VILQEKWNRSDEVRACVDSKNDIATFEEEGFSIALNPSDASIRRTASVSLRTYDFMDVANSILRANDLT
jgi:hydroxymethylpyrimidine pyrophosphatase-like HAD family hydrolase